jgi:hypothetical protein
MHNFPLSIWNIFGWKFLYQEYYILGCDIMQSGKGLPMFRRNILPPFSGSKSRLSKQAANTQHSSRSLVTSVKTSNLKISASFQRVTLNSDVILPVRILLLSRIHSLTSTRVTISVHPQHASTLVNLLFNCTERSVTSLCLTQLWSYCSVNLP